MADVMIPPWVRPESPETIRIIDDATVAFQPAFGRGMTQRGIFADPRWGLRRRYRGLRSDEKSAILNALNESRGQFNAIRVTPHTPIRGSFATSELLSNNTFASGTTGWSGYLGLSTLTVSDRVLRSTLNQNNASTGSAIVNSSAITSLTQYAPYVVRAFVRRGRGLASDGGQIRIGTTSGGNDVAEQTSTSYGMQVAAGVPSSVSSIYILAGGGIGIAGATAGDYFECPYISLARCALVDNGQNRVSDSDAIDQWGLTAITVTTNATVAPDGNSTADRMVETTATSAHVAFRLPTVSSAVADFAVAVALKIGQRPYAYLAMQEATGSTRVEAYFNLTTGVVGTTSTGANWSNLRTFTVDIGNGWFYFCIVARKTNAATTVQPEVGLASADGTKSYTGNASNGMFAWRGTFAQSSVPIRLAQTTSSALSTGTPQTGSAIYTKGWPASTSGLLLPGDWIEINGELKQLTAPVNSDAAGLAYMQFRPGLANSPADNDPIIVYEPFGRFVYSTGTREFENLFGIYGDCEMNLEEVYS